MNKIIVTALVAIFSNVGLAQWAADSALNNPVCEEPGQQNIVHDAAYQQCLASDGAGGVIVVWQDTRNNSAIYAQRVDNNGNLKWNSVGIPIATLASNAWNVLNPCIVSDSKGGAIMVWQRNVAGSGDSLFAQRVDPNGNIKWALNGVLVCGNGHPNEFPVICSDNDGGAIVAWENDISFLNSINVQRLDSDGVAQCTTNGVLVRTGGANYHTPQICSDGKHGAIISWTSDNSYSPVFVQRLDGGGNIKWTPDANPPSSANAIKISAAPNYARIPRIISDGNGGAIVAWDQNPGDNFFNVYAQRIDSNASILWSAGGVHVCSQKSEFANITSDGSGGVIIAWSDFRAGTGWWNIYSQRITSAGAPSWAADGIPIVNNSHIGSAIYPSITTDGNGGAYIAWADNRSSTNHIYEQSVSSSGTVNWLTGGITVSSYDIGFGPSHQQIVSDGSNNAILVWEDVRNSGATNLYAQRVQVNSALPVELISFSASPNALAIGLTWKTATETDNYGFDIERKALVSTPATGWDRIGFVQGAGTTNAENAYSFTDNLPTAGSYAYRLKQIDRDGKVQYSRSVNATAVQLPKVFGLTQNYPNPFNPATMIKYELSVSSLVVLKVYDTVGREVATLADELKEAGSYEAKFDAAQLSSGVYLYTIRAGNYFAVKKMVLIK